MIYIFILSPPFQGSTVLYKILHSSPKTTTLIGNKNWAGEGQWLLPVKLYRKNRWNPNFNLNMDIVKRTYDKHWDLTKEICVEKSPPIVCRAKMYEDYFSKFGKVYFIVNIRSPYATKDNAKSWVRKAIYQKYNIENLKNVLYIKYEELVSNKNDAKQKILDFIPELEDINMDISKVQGIKTNRNQKITDKFADRVINKKGKNKILKNNKDIMDYFGYEFIK